jgi:hypothetical protein
MGKEEGRRRSAKLRTVKQRFLHEKKLSPFLKRREMRRRSNYRIYCLYVVGHQE